MSETKHKALTRRLQAAKMLQFCLCLIFLGWLLSLGTSSTVAQPPSLDTLIERVNRLSERDAEVREAMRAIVESQRAADRRAEEYNKKTDEIYTRGSTLMGLIAVISGYVAITGRKLRSTVDRADSE